MIEMIYVVGTTNTERPYVWLFITAEKTPHKNTKINIVINFISIIFNGLITKQNKKKTQ